MIRAILVFAGLLVVSTGVTPFDMVGHHITDDAMIELGLTVLVLIAGFLAVD